MDFELPRTLEREEKIRRDRVSAIYTNNILFICLKLLYFKFSLTNMICVWCNLKIFHIYYVFNCFNSRGVYTL